MFRYQILIEYVGSNFRGWQVQTKGKTVQGLIQEKISKLLKEKIMIYGAGRLDSGVHAKEQSAHFDCKNEIKKKDKFLKSINEPFSKSNNVGVNLIIFLAISSGDLVLPFSFDSIKYEEDGNSLTSTLLRR